MGEAGEIGREIGRRASLLMASATLSRLTTLTGGWSGWSDWSRVWTTGEAGRARSPERDQAAASDPMLPRATLASESAWTIPGATI